ncbi:MAG TPA: TlpA disulfide reductase family protein [Burkholderiales bacterium]|nr:TlpA disulfide reductase family protein [Burkholderiales bacterium]
MLRALSGALLLAWAITAPAQALRPWSGGATPPIELQDFDGAAHRLADFHGKTVLVNFWATWCVPCREEMPSIERLRRSLDGKPFAVLAVNVGENARAARSFVDAMPARFTWLLDRDTQTAKSWRARVLPASYVVGPDGRIRYSALGALDWSSDEVRKVIEGVMK